MRRLQLWCGFALLCLLRLALVNPAAGQAAGETTWVVSPQGPLTTIQQALELAAPGDTILVKAGAYAGPLVVDKSVRLVGEGRPVIDGGGVGMVVSMTAPGSLLQGFEIRGSGSEPDRDHAGVAMFAEDIQVVDNRLVDVLFGIFVAEADRAVVRGNDITSKAEYDVARKGDAIRVWYSQDVLVDGNIVHEARDLVAWYSSNLVFRNNRVQNGRYGVHLMYSDNATISGNTLLDNSVGIYVMYSSRVTLTGNDIRRQRGPSGYALGFKDADDVLAQDNLLVDNRAGVFMDGTPYRPNAYARFENNIIAFNDIGVLLFSFVKRAEFRSNTLWENVQQTALQGSGKAGENTWEANYWSDYTGFDADGDGTGDVPYRSERFFEGMMDSEPRLRAFIFSPAAQAIEFAALSFPVIRPQPKLEDLRPSVVPLAVPADALPQASRAQSAGLAGSGLALLLVSGLIVWVSKRGATWMERKPKETTNTQADSGVGAPLVQVHRLTKRYSKAVVLQGLDLEVREGDSLALWGENGAGKTTLLKALLGMVHFEGKVTVAGKDAAAQGKQARAVMGYVPQEAVFYDMSVRHTMAFYARLRRADPKRIEPLLEQLGLLGHQHKPVPALSGGLKQRLALAIALLADPPLLLLDEPTANLDARGRQEYLELLLRLRKAGKTIIFASHRLDEVETLANRVILLVAGVKTEELAPDRLRSRLAPEVILTLWVGESQRQQAMDMLIAQGWEAHLNGRGTVVTRLQAADKLPVLQRLEAGGIRVTDFEVEGVNKTWNGA
jgi:nitrous oxidase accessory protein